MGVLFFYLTLLGAASSDVLSARFGLSVNSVIWTFRDRRVRRARSIAGVVAYKLCRELKRRDGPEPPREELERAPRARPGTRQTVGD